MHPLYWYKALVCLATRRGNSARRGEALAARYLRRRGYRILGRNLRNRFGEIDLLLQSPDRHTIVVVEVKTTAIDPSINNPAPETRVGADKRRRLISLACQVSRAFRLQDHPIRFDVIGVLLPPRGRPLIRHHESAFESMI